MASMIATASSSGVALRIFSSPDAASPKMERTSRVQVGADCRGCRVPLGAQNPSHEGTMYASGAAGLHTLTTQSPRNFPDILIPADPDGLWRSGHLSTQ